MSFEQKLLYIFWTGSGASRSPTLRTADGFAVRPATDYLEHVAAKYAKRPPHTARASVDRHTYAIAEFLTYLLANSISLDSIKSQTIADYRDWSAERVKSNKASRGFEHQYKATVNLKIGPIYEMIDWCLEHHLVAPDSIGLGECKVKSSLPAFRKNPNIENAKAENKYPEMFRDFGENSRNSPHQYWATADDIQNIEDHFWRSSTDVALRNSTMLRVVDILGWRMGSSNSISSTQFSPEAFAQRKGQSTYVITPPVQKLDYQKPFPLPWPLAQQIRNYIEDDEFGRAALMKKYGRTEEEVDYQIFLSVTNGMPLKTTSWVTIFADAFSAIGAPKGAGGHAIRRGSADRRGEETVASLQESGLPVTEDAVVTELKEYLGHSSSAAQAAYRRVTRRRRKSTLVEKMAEEIEERKVKGDELRTALAKEKSRAADLERQLAEARKRKSSSRRTTKERKAT